jgi:hypothetical protein
VINRSVRFRSGQMAQPERPDRTVLPECGETLSLTWAAWAIVIGSRSRGHVVKDH